MYFIRFMYVDCQNIEDTNIPNIKLIDMTWDKEFKDSEMSSTAFMFVLFETRLEKILVKLGLWISFFLK